MIRAFVGVEIGLNVVQEIAAAIQDLEPRLPGLRWVPLEKLHLTVKFLGPIEEQRVDPISSALASALNPFSRFTINAKGLGVFPDIRRPRVLWIGLVGECLASLSSALEAAIEPLGFEREKRPFTPHLTLARWRRFNGVSNELRVALERWREHDFGAFDVDKVILFQSVLSREGAVYRPLRIFQLNADGA